MCMSCFSSNIGYFQGIRNGNGENMRFCMKSLSNSGNSKNTIQHCPECSIQGCHDSTEISNKPMTQSIPLIPPTPPPAIKLECEMKTENYSKRKDSSQGIQRNQWNEGQIFTWFSPAFVSCSVNGRIRKKTRMRS